MQNLLAAKCAVKSSRPASEPQTTGNLIKSNRIQIVFTVITNFIIIITHLLFIIHREIFSKSH